MALLYFTQNEAWQFWCNEVNSIYLWTEMLEWHKTLVSEMSVSHARSQCTLTHFSGLFEFLTRLISICYYYSQCSLKVAVEENWGINIIFECSVHFVKTSPLDFDISWVKVELLTWWWCMKDQESIDSTSVVHEYPQKYSVIFNQLHHSIYLADAFVPIDLQ